MVRGSPCSELVWALLRKFKHQRVTQRAAREQVTYELAHNHGLAYTPSKGLISKVYKSSSEVCPPRAPRGRPATKLSDAHVRRIRRAIIASQEEGVCLTEEDIVNDLNLGVSKRTLKRVLKARKDFVFC